MVKGILADFNIVGQVEYLVRLMQAPEWSEFWNDLGLVLYRFRDLGLRSTSTDLEIWLCCQKDHLVLLTDNRNAHGPDSLEAVLREFCLPDSLPVCTIANVRRLATSKAYADLVVERLYECLQHVR